MKIIQLTRFLTAACFLLAISAPEAAPAKVVELTVEHNPAGENHFDNIQAAINHADVALRANPLGGDSFIVRVKADPTPYSGPITPISNVPIIGSSTAGTFIAVSGTGTLINLNNVANVDIRNFTFKNASVGISIANSADIGITNNVFQLLPGGTAIRVQSSPSTSITNNTFHNNGTGIATDSDIIISSDIFSRSTTAISAQVPLNQLSYNLFFNNVSNGVTDQGFHSIPNSVVINPDPLFLDENNGDFHLKAGSPAIDSGDPSQRDSFDGTTSDMGAYGGPNSDILSAVPATVTGLDSSISSPSAPTVMSLTWNRSVSTAVTGYRVYYRTSSGNDVATEGASPLFVSGTGANLSFDALPPAPALPAPPVLTSVIPLDQALQLNWSASSGATGYLIYYSTSSFDASSLPATPAPVEVGGGTTTQTLTGLSNGTPYFVAVAALAQARIFAAVTAVIDSAVGSAPGTANESPLSQETGQGVGPAQVSGISSLETGIPEAIAPYPNLKGEGCFIATAAYGFYSAPQVQVLREFRDRYLSTHAPGRAFVAWYYRYGPEGAHFINAHPWLKPPVRLALLPLVAGAFLLIYTPPLAQIGIIAILAWSVFRYRRAQRVRRNMLLYSGGTR